MTGTGVGDNGFIDAFPAGPLPSPSFTTFLNPFGLLDGDGVPSADVTGFYLAVEFSPQVVVPTPEPASLAVLGSGLFAFGLLRRRRRSPRHYESAPAESCGPSVASAVAAAIKLSSLLASGLQRDHDAVKRTWQICF